MTIFLLKNRILKSSKIFSYYFLLVFIDYLPKKAQGKNNDKKVKNRRFFFRDFTAKKENVIQLRQTCRKKESRFFVTRDSIGNWLLFYGLSKDLIFCPMNPMIYESGLILTVDLENLRVALKLYVTKRSRLLKSNFMRRLSSIT